jgi:hypothetical protein
LVAFALNDPSNAFAAEVEPLTEDALILVILFARILEQSTKHRLRTVVAVHEDASREEEITVVELEPYANHTTPVHSIACILDVKIELVETDSQLIPSRLLAIPPTPTATK